MNLNQNHASVSGMTTIHPKFVLRKEGDNFIRNESTVVKSAVLPLKEGTNNTKLCGGKGEKIPCTVKGRWLNMPIYSLTLVERETCPSYCKFIRTCYGNNMGMAHRYKMSDEVLDLIDSQLQHLNRIHRYGFLVRLHVLGDFDTPKYTNFWYSAFEKYRKLHVWGYTARIDFNVDDERYDPNDSEIFQIIEKMNLQFKDRCLIRFSGYEDDPKRVDYRVALSESESLAQELISQDKAIVCPYQVINEKTGKRLTSSCSNCGLCWSNSINKAIIWVEK